MPPLAGYTPQVTELKAALLGSIILCLAYGPARAEEAPPPILARIEAKWASLTDYTCDIESHEQKGSRAEYSSCHFFFKKPMRLRAEILDGSRTGAKGSVSVYNGGDKVQGHMGGLMSMLTLSLGLNDPMILSIRGDRMTDMPWGHQIELLHAYETAHAHISIGPPTQIEGVETVPLIMTSDDATFIAGNQGIAHEVIYYDSKNDVPVQLERSETVAGPVVIKSTFRNIRLNVGLSDSVFNLRGN
jgi:outer membrane lipoprotein-sorting protein